MPLLVRWLNLFRLIVDSPRDVEVLKILPPGYLDHSGVDSNQKGGT